ncbi:MAG TPA: DUF929 family protein [Acidimicrobiales bacterium]|nr:DUF929 family protein [Acidimicrobiales bacterium]
MTTLPPGKGPQEPSPGRPFPMGLLTWAFIGLILLLVLSLVVVKVTEGSAPTPVSTVPPAPASVVAGVTGLPSTPFDAGAQSFGPGPQLLSGQPPLDSGGRPEVVFVGAESSPYSEAATWAVVAALGRFGTFSGLGSVTSPTTEVFGPVPGFSFAGSVYRSTHLVFQAVERDGPSLSTVAPAGYPALQQPSALVASLLRRYGGPAGSPSLPFVDVANRLVLEGADTGVSPDSLAGQSMTAVAAQLADPASTLSRAVLDSADEMSAAICAVDGSQPDAVCSGPGVVAAQEQLGIG